MATQFDLTLNAYCGMPIPVQQGEREDVRQAAARLIRRLRGKGFPVVTLETGEEWDVQEPDGCCLVPDYCGILRIKPVPSPYGKCFECGSEDDWHEDSRGNVLCDCQACPDCGMVDAYGFHNAGCPQLQERCSLCDQPEDECTCNDFLYDQEEDCCEEEPAQHACLYLR